MIPNELGITLAGEDKKNKATGEIEHTDGAIDKNPELVKLMVEMHRKATEYAMGNRAEMVKMTMQKLGQQQKSIELAAPNVQLTWRIDDEFIKRAKAYGALMLEKKQIRELPNFDRFINTKFMPANVPEAPAAPAKK